MLHIRDQFLRDVQFLQTKKPEIKGFFGLDNRAVQTGENFFEKIKPKSDYPLKTLYPRAFQTGQNHLIYYDFTTVE